MRDHSKLKAFLVADELVLNIYKATRSFPKEELFGLTSQIRRSAVSVPSNIVEGCARETEAEYLRYLGIAYGSARELEYQLSLAFRLGYLNDLQFEQLHADSVVACKVLNGLIRAVKQL